MTDQPAAEGSTAEGSTAEGSTAEGSTWTLASFKTELGKVLVELNKDVTTRSDLYIRLASFGIPRPKITSGDTVEFDIPDDTISVAPGVKLADLNDEARAKYENERLTQLRQKAYRHLKRGSYNTAAVTGALSRLGLPVPQQVTEVSAEIPRADGTYQRLAFSLPGEHTEGDIKAKLVAETQEPAENETIRRLFPEATGLRGTEPMVSAYTTTNWTPYNEIA